MKNYTGRLTKLEKKIDEIINPLAKIAIFVFKSAGETLESNIIKMENETEEKIDRNNSIIFTFTGVDRI